MQSETRHVNNDNFATIGTQNNPSNLSSIYENDSNSESEAVVENCTIFHSTSKKKVEEKWELCLIIKALFLLQEISI